VNTISARNSGAKSMEVDPAPRPEGKRQHGEPTSSDDEISEKRTAVSDQEAVSSSDEVIYDDYEIDEDLFRNLKRTLKKKVVQMFYGEKKKSPRPQTPLFRKKNKEITNKYHQHHQPNICSPHPSTPEGCSTSIDKGPWQPRRIILSRQ
jgi:hypothetical protein